MKSIFAILICLPYLCYAEVSFLGFTKETKREMTHCLDNPPSGSGNNYVNICYGEAADKIFARAQKKVGEYVAGLSDVDDIKEAVEERLFFEKSVEYCELREELSTFHVGKITEVHICKGA